MLIPLFVPLLTTVSIAAHVLAQSGDLEWVTPANLSRSGTASSPVIVVVPNGRVRILWWDKFEGLMLASGPVTALRSVDRAAGESAEGEGWSAPVQAPILLPTTVNRGGQEVTIPLPIENMPYIIAGTDGKAHAFWLGAPDVDTGNRPLLYSRLVPGTASWSEPSSLAGAAASFAATADVSGTLHVAYLQPVAVGESPIGLYYRQSPGDGEWSARTLVQRSRYLRLLPSQGDAIHLTADDSKNVYVTWDDPQRGQTVVTQSNDAGATWLEPRPVAPSDDHPLRNRVIGLPGRSEPVLWRVADEGQSRMAVSSSGEALTLAIWDGARWSQTKRLSLQLEDPESGKPLYLSDLQPALAAASPESGQTGQTLIVVGVDQTQDLWVTGIEIEALAHVLAPLEGPPASQAADGQVGAGQPVPANLSRSGAASSPAVVVGPGGTLHAFWWDRFDGLMVADGTVLATSVLSGTQQIVTTRDSWSEPRPVPLPATSTPRILADAKGGIHAFWLQQPTQEPVAEEAKPQIWPLMYSRLTGDATAWLPARILAESAVAYDVATDASGALHVAYITTVDTSTSAGIYYRRTEEDGARWSAPVALVQSRYIRLLGREAAYIRVAVEDAGAVYVTWDDPRLEELVLAHSPDGGKTWRVPRPLANQEGQPQRGQLVTIPGSETLLIWEDASSGLACSLYQAPAHQLASGTPSFGQPILEELSLCPENVQFLPFGKGQVLMVAGLGSDTLILAAWNGERWSEPKRLGYRFPDPERMRQVYLSSLQTALVRLAGSSSEGVRGSALVAVGIDLENDVWATSTQVGLLELILAPLPPWSTPVEFAQSENNPGFPAVAADSAGQAHVLWSQVPADSAPGGVLLYARQYRTGTSTGEQVRWTDPTTVFRVPDGEVAQPGLVVVGDELHAVWRGGQNAQILYSHAFVADAHVANGWAEPQRLSAPAALVSWPDIAAEISGPLHAVYAVPINEGRGLYYTRSEDGEIWSEPRQIFDAAAAGWDMSDHPRLAVDLDGTIHVVWIHANPLGNRLPQEIFYTHSVDGGQTWSKPLKIAEGICDWPAIAVNQTEMVELAWNEPTGDQAWWHQWSVDGGIAWTQPERVPGFENVAGAVSLVADGGGTTHLVGLGRDHDENPAIRYLTWDGRRWGEPETFRLDLALAEPVPGLSAAVLPALGQLHVVFRAEGAEEGEVQRTSLWHTERVIPVVAATPVPTLVARALPTALPTSTPPVLPTATLSFSRLPPPGSGNSLTGLLPLVLAGGLAVLITGGVFGMRYARTRRLQVHLRAGAHDRRPGWLSGRKEG